MAESTLEIHRRHLARLFSLPDPFKPLAIQEALIQLEPCARSRAFSVYRRFFRFALVQGWVDRDPTEVCKAPSCPLSKSRGWTAPELSSFLAALDRLCASSDWRHRFASRRLRLMVDLSLAFGVRPGQHLDLELADWQATTMVLNLPPKYRGHAYRPVKLSPELSALVDEYLAVRLRVALNTARLWVNNFGQPLTRAALARQLEQVCATAGLPVCGGLHKLRSTVSLFLIEEGSTFFEVQNFLGHEKPSSTDYYLRQHFPGDYADALAIVRSKLARLPVAGPEAAGAGTDKPPAPALPLKKGTCP